VASVLVEGEAFNMQVLLLHSMALTNTHPHRELAESVMLVIAAGADINAEAVGPECNQRTALMCAAGRKCCTRALDVLLQAGADASLSTSMQQTTALHSAAAGGLTGSCEILLKQADMLLDVKDINGWTALLYAAHGGCLNVVQLLLQHGADINAVDIKRNNALMIAACTGNIAVAQLLLDSGADINGSDIHGQNSLFKTVYKGHVSMIELLVQHRLTVTTVSNDGWTLLMVAAKGSHKAAAEWLIQHLVYLDAVNNSGGTALHIACCSDSDDADMVELLLANGADVHKRIGAGRTALDGAVLRGNIECVKVLIAAGADVNRADSDGASSLHVAVGKNNSAAVQLLLEHGATAVVNSVILEWCTLGTQCCSSAIALMMCTGVETVQQLLAAGADVHMTNNAGDTCLHVAAKHNWKAPLICLLIKAGADLHAVNNESKTAAQLAHDRGHTLVKLLLIRAARD
jgi:ankyrin repeat protein